MKIKSAEFEKSATRREHYPTDGFPEIAFVGRSNVGKSSLINSILGRKRLARTSNTPGRTQLINFFRINGRIFFVDLPGYGYAKVPVSVKKYWGPMIENYLTMRAELCLIIFILDIRRDPSKDDLALFEWLGVKGIPHRFILTKADKLSKNKMVNRQRLIAASLGVHIEDTTLFSAKTSLGRDQVLSVIESFAEQRR